MTIDAGALDRYITGNYGMDLVEEDDETIVAELVEDDQDYDSMPGGADWKEYDEFYEDYFPDGGYDFYD